MSGAVVPLSGITVWLCAEDGPPLDGEQAALDIVGEAYGSGAEIIALPVARLAPGFLTLSTRIAGLVTQKFVNYGFRTAIIGDISEAVAASDALRDYVRESNRGRHIWFLENLDALAAKLT